MDFYQILAPFSYGSITDGCIAARCHQEAVDIRIENQARNATNVFEGYVTTSDAEWLITDQVWLFLFDGPESPAKEVTIGRLVMPTVPYVAEIGDHRRIAIDVEESLKRQGVIDPDFSLNVQNNS